MTDYTKKPDLYGVDTIDIARNLCHKIHNISPLLDVENALYYLKTAAENEYNHDYFRVFYNVLCEITENDERGA